MVLIVNSVSIHQDFNLVCVCVCLFVCVMEVGGFRGGTGYSDAQPLYFTTTAKP